MTKPELSLIFPAYNEEELIQDTLDKAVNYLKKLKINWEIIVVDDGSKDKTAATVRKYGNKNVSLIRLSRNLGKGAALRRGMLEAHGDYLIFSDADLSVDIKRTKDFFLALKSTDVAIASRRTKGSDIVVHQPFARESMGKVFTALTRFLMGVNLSDFTCGFKGFRKEAAQDVFSHAKIDRWAYDAEILFLSHKYGYEIKEIPVAWKNREDTKVKLFDAIVTSFRDLIRIRWWNILGKYEKTSK